MKSFCVDAHHCPSESEFYSLTRGGAQGIQMNQSLEIMKVMVELVLLSNSSAARGI